MTYVLARPKGEGLHQINDAIINNKDIQEATNMIDSSSNAPVHGGEVPETDEEEEEQEVEEEDYTENEDQEEEQQYNGSEEVE